MVLINVALCLFNLIPVHPLDGQKVLSGMLPGDVAIRFERFNAKYGMMLLMAVVIFGGRIIEVPFVALVNGLVALFGVR